MRKGSKTKKWQEWEIQFIKDNFLKFSKKEIAEKLDRSWRSIVHKCEQLELEYPKPKPGDKFNRLEIQSIKLVKYKNRKHQISVATCLCDCGNTKDIMMVSILNENTKSCGCLWEEVEKAKGKEIHNLSNHILYKKWASMKRRCSDPKSIGYHIYGGKGIKVCEEWENSFIAFYNWAMENGYKEGLTIDRKNGNLGYNPENCRWITMKEQNNNKCNNRLLTVFGETKTYTEWLDDPRCIVKNLGTLNSRIELGWEPELAITDPARKNIDIKYQGETKSLYEWVKDDRCLVKNSVTLYGRIFNYGWDVEKAFTTPIRKSKLPEGAANSSSA